MSMAFHRQGIGNSQSGTRNIAKRISERPRIAWFSLPPLCVSRAWWGVECPGCGLTRSFVALSSGELVESLRLHRVGWLLYIAVVGKIPYRAYKLRQLGQAEAAGSAVGEPAWPIWFGRLLIAALIGNWLLKISGF